MTRSTGSLRRLERLRPLAQQREIAAQLVHLGLAQRCAVEAVLERGIAAPQRGEALVDRGEP
ncbi:hypothetical protein [Benzoatithermus flavus]|uniref:Ferrous iron transport protein A n=1 Tax=Benzoatithermus flavus TaxID=3108223 RepID=A0ABU8XRZ3_9PROT